MQRMFLTSRKTGRGKVKCLSKYLETSISFWYHRERLEIRKFGDFRYFLYGGVSVVNKSYPIKSEAFVNSTATNDHHYKKVCANICKPINSHYFILKPVRQCSRCKQSNQKPGSLANDFSSQLHLSTPKKPCCRRNLFAHFPYVICENPLFMNDEAMQKNVCLRKSGWPKKYPPGRQRIHFFA